MTFIAKRNEQLATEICEDVFDNAVDYALDQLCSKLEHDDNYDYEYVETMFMHLAIDAIVERHGIDVAHKIFRKNITHHMNYK